LKKNHFTSILSEVPDYSRFLRVAEIERLAKKLRQFPSVEERTIGKTAGNNPLKMYIMGEGEKTAFVIGVPHSDEPLGSLVTTYFLDWMARNPEVGFFGWRWLMIPVLERRGMQMNEGWFDNIDSLVCTAKNYFREPTENQYEWTFPFEYKKYKWTHPRPESNAVKETLKNERPDLLCNLHHSGYQDTYFYFSEDLPETYSKLRRLSNKLNLPLSTSNPDVPFGKILKPGFYQMYGLKDYIDYYARHEPENLFFLRRGASSDEWYQEAIGGFSFNCEVPLFKSSVKKDNKKSSLGLKDLLEKRIKKRVPVIQYCIDVLTRMEPFFRFSDPLLLGAVLKHVANAKLELESAKTNVQTAEKRCATNFEVFENDIMVDVANLLLMGQIWRVTEMIDRKQRNSMAANLARAMDKKISELSDGINRRGGFVPIPIRNIIKMQLGSILIIADVLSNH
jgi:hypothetical protein